MKIPANNPGGCFKIGDSWITSSKQIEVKFPASKDVDLKFEMGKRSDLKSRIDLLLNDSAGDIHPLQS